MNDDAGETIDEDRDATREVTEGWHTDADGGPPPDADATGVYGTGGWHPVDTEAPGGQSRPGGPAPAPDGPATSVYGTTGAPTAQWATPGEPSPQPTTVQPIPGQPAQPQPTPAQPGAAQWAPTGPAPGSPPTQAYPQMQPAAATTSAYGSPQPMPTAQAQQVPTGYAPAGYAAGPAPTGGRHWNLWAGIPAAASLFALGGLWRLVKIGTSAFDFPFRQQFAIAVMAAAVVAGVAALAALASKKRTLAAPLAFVLGGVLLVDVVYGWYLQMDSTIGSFDASFLFDTLIPFSLPSVLLASATMAAALVMRVDGGRR